MVGLHFFPKGKYIQWYPAGYLWIVSAEPFSIHLYLAFFLGRATGYTDRYQRAPLTSGFPQMIGRREKSVNLFLSEAGFRKAVSFHWRSLSLSRMSQVHDSLLGSNKCSLPIPFSSMDDNRVTVTKSIHTGLFWHPLFVKVFFLSPPQIILFWVCLIGPWLIQIFLLWYFYNIKRKFPWKNGWFWDWHRKSTRTRWA